ncbi:hypothetical protein LXM61_25765 [Priestia megaterium]|uniref:hypothetical protein n=1 Tax=Priestia megaterium TaxID=1404 RepID=UPI001E5756DD|nr:hypothetical protein [Priestia megaterium]MCE4092559.1 hypothetical protein [Priestia megaterium]
MAIEGKVYGSKSWYCEHEGCLNIVDKKEQYCIPCLNSHGAREMGIEKAVEKLDELNS